MFAMILNPLITNDRPKFLPERQGNKVAAENFNMARRDSRRLKKMTNEENLHLESGEENVLGVDLLIPNWTIRNSSRSKSIPNITLEDLLSPNHDIKNLRRGSLLWSSAAEVEVAEPHFPFEELEKAKKNKTVPPLDHVMSNENDLRTPDKLMKRRQFSKERMSLSMRSPSIPAILEEKVEKDVNLKVENCNSDTSAPQKATKADLWSVFRSHISTAKAKEAFETSKIYVNNKPHRVLRKIGMGDYSEVFEVVDENSHLYVLKYVTLPDTRIRENLLQEVHFLQKLKDNSRVIKLIDYETKTNPDCLLMILEHGESNLEHIVRKLIKKGSFSPAKLRYFWEEMLEVLQSVHKCQIVHADLKPSNFVICDGSLKIIDFGLAVDLNEGKVWTRRNFIGGTRDFVSPETWSSFQIEDGALKDSSQLQDQQSVVIGYKSDIWALGIILYKWMYGDLVPYSDLAGGKLSKITALTNKSIPIEFKKLEDTQVLETLKMCLEKDPFERATLEELLSHKFLHPINSSSRSSLIPTSQFQAPPQQMDGQLQV